jgi:hypothetical protein
MFGADPGIVEPSRYRVRVLDLTVVVHQEISAVAVKHTGASARDRCGMQLRKPMPGRFHAENLDRGVIQERVKQAHCIGAAADASDQRIRQTPFSILNLLTGLVADD